MAKTDPRNMPAYVIKSGVVEWNHKAISDIREDVPLSQLEEIGGEVLEMTERKYSRS